MFYSHLKAARVGRACIQNLVLILSMLLGTAWAASLEVISIDAPAGIAEIRQGTTTHTVRLGSTLADTGRVSQILADRIELRTRTQTTWLIQDAGGSTRVIEMQRQAESAPQNRALVKTAPLSAPAQERR